MISIENLHFAYSKNRVFNGIGTHLQPGHIYGILGKNGTGKSKLLHLISGLLFPTEGTITVMGFTPGKRQPSFLRMICCGHSPWLPRLRCLFTPLQARLGARSTPFRILPLPATSVA